jgi:chemosensory pili system protein ChpA (sensor histidine kinase/response regulator)
MAVGFIDFASVKKTLIDTLTRAGDSLQILAQNPHVLTELNRPIKELKDMKGVLLMMQLEGAALIIQELLAFLQAVQQEKLHIDEKNMAVINTILLRLPNYFVYIDTAKKEVPVVFFSLINQLRLLRKERFLQLSEIYPRVLVPQNLPPVLAKYQSNKPLTQAEIQMLQKLAAYFQQHYVNWCGKNDAESFAHLGQALDKVLNFARFPEALLLFWLTSSLLEQPLESKVVDKVFLRPLLDPLGRKINDLSKGSDVLFKDTATMHLIKSALILTAMLPPQGKRIPFNQKFFLLAQYDLPTHVDLNQAQITVSGLDANLLQKVSVNVRENLSNIRELIDGYIQESVEDEKVLKEIMRQMNIIYEIFGMLRLDFQQKQIRQQLAVLNQVVKKEKAFDTAVFMSLAEVLVEVEFALDQLKEKGEAYYATLGKDISQQENKQQQSLAALVKHASADIGKIKDVLIVYSSNPGDKALLKALPERLRALKNTMFVAPLDKISPVLEELSVYIEKTVLPFPGTPSDIILQLLADTTVSIEFFFEEVSKGRTNFDEIVSRAKDFLYKLSITDLNAVKEVRRTEKAFAPPEPKAVTAPVSSENSDKEAFFKKVSGLAVIDLPNGEEPDMEMLEIFIEESTQMLEEITENLRLLRENNKNSEALAVIRRAFHTLKGSGRMVGAKLNGEFAWEFENMLNRVIDKTIPMSTAVLEAIEDAIAVLPKLIKQLESPEGKPIDVAPLMYKANQLAKGQSVSA